jgi:hypothetical protein
MAECLTLLEVEDGHYAGDIMVSSDSIEAVSAVPLFLPNSTQFFDLCRGGAPVSNTDSISDLDLEALCDSQQVLRVHFSLLRRLPKSLIPPFLIELRTQINSFD